jgi:hypothetical protein
MIYAIAFSRQTSLINKETMRCTELGSEEFWLFQTPKLKIYCPKLFILFRNRVFMASSTGNSQLKDALSKYNSNDLASIIEKLSGNKDNLRVDMQHVKFCVGKQHFETYGSLPMGILNQPIHFFRSPVFSNLRKNIWLTQKQEANPQMATETSS